VQVRLDSGDYYAGKQATTVNTNTLNTRHTVTLDSNGYVSGTESVNTGSSASFTVQADKFLIAKPNGSGIPIPLLALGTVGGVTALGLSGNLIVDGSIVGRALDVNTITAEKINGTNLNVVNGTFSGTIAAGSVDFASSVGSNFSYTSAGNYTLIVPTGMTSMRVTIKGGGGGGAGGSTRGSGYGGGGAEGATATTLLTVTPGQTFTLRVGAGGTGGAGMDAPFSYQYASAGQETFINGVIAAGGGAAGVLTNAGGHESGDGWSYYGDQGGGTYGGLGATTYYQSGQAGILGGGGGGGGAGTSAIYHTQPQPTNGGNGGAGIAKIEYFDPNGLVLKSSLDALKAELRTQGLTIT
jgi:hypothetical protein